MDVEILLVDAESSFCTTVVSQVGIVTSTSARTYGSPKSEKAVSKRIEGAVPLTDGRTISYGDD